jgi:eukaryotic-like serine/threonine-protein kinase
MSLELPFRQGEIVAQKYRIVRVLGSGGMGMVFEADHVGLDRRVALKVMVRNVDTEQAAVARFLREARAAARLNSPHVAKVLDVGQLGQGAPFLVMELLEGSDLQTLLKEQGPLAVDTAVDYLLEACEALAEAHHNGIIHRDLKPANLFLASDAYGGDMIKLLDFGVSKIMFGNADPQLTDTHSMIGSPAYMSPEQMRSTRDVDQRSDIWSLGAVLFEMVTGRVAWSGSTLGDVLLNVANEPAPTVRSFLPAAPAELDAAIARCLEKNPARRYQSVVDLALALHPLGTSRARAALDRVLRISGQNLEPALTTQQADAPAVGVAVTDHAPPSARGGRRTLLYGGLPAKSEQAPAMASRGTGAPGELAGALCDVDNPEAGANAPAQATRTRPTARRIAVGSVLGVLVLATLSLVLAQRGKANSASHAAPSSERATHTLGAPQPPGHEATAPTPPVDAEAPAPSAQGLPPAQDAPTSATREPPPAVSTARSRAGGSGTALSRNSSKVGHSTLTHSSALTQAAVPMPVATSHPVDPMSVRR